MTQEEHNMKLIVCKCEWEDYYDYRIMSDDGMAHVRVSFFEDEIIISDLFVNKKCRHQGYATALLDEVDRLLDGLDATITPANDWTEKWYLSRGYKIKKN